MSSLDYEEPHFAAAQKEKTEELEKALRVRDTSQVSLSFFAFFSIEKKKNNLARIFSCLLQDKILYEIKPPKRQIG